MRLCCCFLRQQQLYRGAGPRIDAVELVVDIVVAACDADAEIEGGVVGDVTVNRQRMRNDIYIHLQTVAGNGRELYSPLLRTVVRASLEVCTHGSDEIFGRDEIFARVAAAADGYCIVVVGGPELCIVVAAAFEAPAGYCEVVTPELPVAASNLH